MREHLEALLLKADVPNPERAELLWAEYRAATPQSDAAFQTLLAWYGLAIYRHIWGFLRSDAAEDVFQDVLVKWHQERHKLASFEHALRWMRTVAIRKCVDAYRRELRRRKREAKNALPPDAASSSDQYRELQDSLAQALQKLPERQREAIALVYFEELDRQVAATVLGVHRHTLTQWLEEALTRLKDLVPVPALLVAGSAVSLPAILEAKPPVHGSAWLREVAARAAAQAASSGHAVKGMLVVLGIGLVLTSGMAVAGWQLTHEPAPEPRPQGPKTEPPVATAKTEPTSVKVESVPERNLRIFRTEVLPKQIEALRSMVIGDGTVELESVEAYNIRVLCVYCLHHKSEDLPGWVSRIEI